MCRHKEACTTDSSILTALRKSRPRVHSITNYVTAEACANLLHACGALPIMADAPEEAAEITAQSRALNLNLGTLNPARAEAMRAAGSAANRLGIPVVLDPVGAGATAFRRQTAAVLLREIRFAAVKGNASELRYLAGAHAMCCGADAADADAGSLQNAEIAAALAKQTGAVIMMTGETDLVTDGKQLFRVHNGHPMMTRITGSGCMLSALTAAYLAVRPEQPLQACLTALCAMGLAGEAAAKRMTAADGNMMFRNALIDAVFRMTEQDLKEGARYEADG